MKILIVCNPVSGYKNGTDIVREVIDVFFDRKIPSEDYQIFYTEYHKHAEIYLSKKSTNLDSLDLILIIGGDGTIHEVLNGLMNREDELIIPLGILGGGTGNALLRDMGKMEMTTKEKLEGILDEDYHINMDIGELKYLNSSMLQETVYFFNMVGLGIAVDSNILAEKRRFLRKYRYDVCIRYNILKYKSYPIEYRINNEPTWHEVNSNCIMIQNTIHGADMKLAPMANIEDGVMDFVFNKELESDVRFRKIHGIKRLADLLSKIKAEGEDPNVPSYIEEEDIFHKPFHTLELKSSDLLQLNIDGENIGNTKVIINVLQGRIPIK